MQFGVLGAFLFVLFSWLNPEEADNKIIIDKYDLNELVAKWNLQWQRNPTEAELKGLLDNYIKEEIMYREALEMNLDHNDEIIRRRMAQKVQFLTQDIANSSEPTEDELEQYLSDNQNDYMDEARFTFEQAYFSPDKRQDARTDAQKALSGNPSKLADRSPVSNQFVQITLSRIGSELGQQFADGIEELEVKQNWQGPIQSGFGYHLIRLTEKNEAKALSLDQVRDRVVNDYQYDLRRQIDDELYKGLLSKYEVVLDFEEAEEYQTMAQ